MQDVDILITFMTSPYFSFYYKEFFFDYMLSDNLAKHCHILIRIQHDREDVYDPKVHYNYPPRPSDLDDVMSRHGLERKKIKAKISELAHNFILHHNIRVFPKRILRHHGSV